MATYYIGDPTYVLTDDQITDGDFYCFDTAFGDGEYFDTKGNRYLVDSGRLACIDADSITEVGQLNDLLGMGIAHIFDMDDLLFCDCGSADGVIWFGDCVIDTN